MLAVSFLSAFRPLSSQQVGVKVYSLHLFPWRWGQWAAPCCWAIGSVREPWGDGGCRHSAVAVILREVEAEPRTLGSSNNRVFMFLGRWKQQTVLCCRALHRSGPVPIHGILSGGGLCPPLKSGLAMAVCTRPCSFHKRHPASCELVLGQRKKFLYWSHPPFLLPSPTMVPPPTLPGLWYSTP